MPNQKPSLYLYALPAIIISAFLALSLVSAWTEPTVAPPGGNVSTPLNIGSATQDKAGWFTFQGGGTRQDTFLATTFGNVGIGTTSPSTKLEMFGVLRVQGPAGTYGGWGTGGWAVELGRDDNYGYVGSFDRSSSTYKPLYLFASKILLNPAGEGNVGIGTTGPGAKLDVRGDVRVGANAFTNQTGDLGVSRDTAPTTGAIYLGNANSRYLYFDGTNYQFGGGGLYVNTSGYVGIGTTGPGAKLEVAGQIKITGGTPGAGRVLTSDASGLATWEAVAGGASSWTLSGSNLYPSQTSYNVGIGTTSPGYKLDVAGDIRSSGSIYRSAAGAGYLNGQYGSAETTGTSGAIYSIGGSYVPGTITLGNMYGIGYGYSGGAGITFSGLPSNLWGMYVASGGTPSIFLSSGDGKIYATSGIFSGNIGIGTTSPASTLHVNTSGSSAMRFTRSGANTYGFEIGGTVLGLYDYTNSAYRWRVWGSDLLLNESIGNVGIGTAGPTQKLEVAGNVKITGAGIYNSAGSQLVETNATDWTRWNQGSGSINGNAMYQSLSLGTGGLAVGTWSNQGVGNIYATGNITAGGDISTSAGITFGGVRKTTWPVVNYSQQYTTVCSPGRQQIWTSGGTCPAGQSISGCSTFCRATANGTAEACSNASSYPYTSGCGATFYLLSSGSQMCGTLVTYCIGSQ